MIEQEVRECEGRPRYHAIFGARWRSLPQAFSAFLRPARTRLGTGHMFVFFLIVNLWFALNDRRGPHFLGVSVTATTEQASKAWGWSDAGSYLQMGISLATTGGISENLRWTLAFWPPGQAAVSSTALKIMGINGQFILFLLVLNCLLVASLFALIWRLAQRHIGGLLSLLAILAVYSTDLVRVYLLRNSVIWSDGWTALCLSFSVVCAISAVGSRRGFLWIIGSGFAAGLAAYVRGQYFSMIQLALGIVGLLFLLLLLRLFISRLSRKKNKPRTKPSAFAKNFGGVALWTIALIMTCAPYALWRASEIGDIPWDTNGKLTWTSTEAFAMMGNWIPPSDQVAFIREGGGGAACVISRKRCEKIAKLESASPSPYNIYDQDPISAEEYRSFTFQSLKSDPFGWISYKLPIFWRYWFSEPAISSPGRSEPIIGSLSLIGLLLAIGSPFLLRSFARLFVPSCVFIVCLVATFGPPFVGHLEVRYLAWPKIVGLITMSLSLALLLKYLSKELRMCRTRSHTKSNEPLQLDS